MNFGSEQGGGPWVPASRVDVVDDGVVLGTSSRLPERLAGAVWVWAWALVSAEVDVGSEVKDEKKYFLVVVK